MSATGPPVAMRGGNAPLSLPTDQTPTITSDALITAKAFMPGFN